jgi:hypothetical protein
MNQLQTQTIPEIEIDYSSPRFDELFLDAVDQTLSALGINVKNAFLSFLDAKYNLSKENIPDRVGDFVDGLEYIFGPGALPLELRIMRNLSQSVPTFNYVTKQPDLGFEVYVESLKQHIELF